MNDVSQSTPVTEMNNGDVGWTIPWVIFYEGEQYFIADHAPIQNTKGGTVSLCVSKRDNKLFFTDNDIMCISLLPDGKTEIVYNRQRFHEKWMAGDQPLLEIYPESNE